jgi:3',5'-cyclic AMP phosphodiesterase CpdA
MRTIVHLSDIHFGRFDDALAAPLLTTIHELAPDLVVISGDLTQRARPHQFEQARVFLRQIERPLLVVPGNHDIPMLNIAERVLDPLRRYRRYVTADLAPVFADEEMMVVGINSARSVSARSGGGRVNRRQVDEAVALFASTSAAVTKIVVSHHPFDVPEGHSQHHLVGRAHPAMRKLAAAGADLFLAGHLHRSHVSGTAARYKIAGHCALVVQAGTLSTRLRRERNAFNVIRLARPEASIEHHTWDPEHRGFPTSWSAAYRHGADGWLPTRPS